MNHIQRRILGGAISGMVGWLLSPIPPAGWVLGAASVGFVCSAIRLDPPKRIDGGRVRVGAPMVALIVLLLAFVLPIWGSHPDGPPFPGRKARYHAHPIWMLYLHQH